MLSSIKSKTNVIKEYKYDTNNIGSTETQVILLTLKINKLQNHFEKHKNDFHSKRGLLCMVAKRRKLLRYLKYKNIDIYNKLIEELELRK